MIAWLFKGTPGLTNQKYFNRGLFMNNKLALILLNALVYLIILVGSANGSGLDPDLKRAIVLIERGETTREGKDTLVAHGTGFIVWHYGDPARRILLTAKHLFVDRDSVFIRFNKRSQYIQEDGVATKRQVMYLKDEGKVLWTAHPDTQVDLAGIALQVDTLIDVIAVPFSFFKQVSTVTEGEEVLFLGFPLGLTGLKRNYPIVRTGMVALKTDEGIGGEDVFLIDAEVFGGNSGSPVFLRPAPLEGADTVKFSPSFFIGIIIGNIEELERHVIHDTRIALIVNFPENAGLGKVIPAERIVELLELLWGKTVREIIGH